MYADYCFHDSSLISLIMLDSQNNSVSVIHMPSAEIVARAYNYAGYGYTSPPDVAISFNAEQAVEYNTSAIFTPFVLSNYTLLQPQLLQLRNISLQYTKPYQYNLISLIYDKTKLPAYTPLFNVTASNGHSQSSFYLEKLFTTNVIVNLTIENPLIDDSGLGFLLWTI